MTSPGHSYYEAEDRFSRQESVWKHKARIASAATPEEIAERTPEQHMDLASIYQTLGDVTRAQLELTWATVKLASRREGVL